MKLSSLTREELGDEIAKAISRMEVDDKDRFTLIAEWPSMDLMMLIRKEVKTRGGKK